MYVVVELLHTVNNKSLAIDFISREKYKLEPLEKLFIHFASSYNLEHIQRIFSDVSFITEDNSVDS